MAVFTIFDSSAASREAVIGSTALDASDPLSALLGNNQRTNDVLSNLSGLDDNTPGPLVGAIGSTSTVRMLNVISPTGGSSRPPTPNMQLLRITGTTGTAGLYDAEVVTVNPDDNAVTVIRTGVRVRAISGTFAVNDIVQASRVAYTTNPHAGFAAKQVGIGNIVSVNGDTTAAQVLSVGTTGTDFAIDDSTPGTHKFNLPSASATARGAVTTTSQTFAGNKSFTGNVDTSGTLYVSLTTHLVGDVDCDSNLNVDGYATVTGSVTTHDSFIGFNNSLGVDAGRYFTIIQDTAVSTWETRSAYNTVAGPPNYNLSFLSLGAVLTGSVGVSGSCHVQAVLSGQVWDVSSFIDDPQPFFAVNDGSTTYRGQWGTDACGNIVAGGLIVNLGSTPISVSKGGTGRTTLDSGQLLAGAGTSAVDSLSSTRVVGETIELKLGSDSWIAFSEGSF